MIFRKLLIFFLFFLLSCETNISNQNKISYKQNKDSVFINKGFTLIYDDNLLKEKIINKKINDEDLIIFQKNLKKNTKVLITNINNQKTIIAKVGSKSKYPFFYNSVISKRIANILNLNEENPYVEIKKINQNNSFIANTAKTFDEEKKVATKAPVEKIKIKDLTMSKVAKVVTKKNNFDYSIFIADFYFEDSSYLMVSRIKENTSIQNIKVTKISNNQYRVSIGPLRNLSSLKNTFNELKILNLENVEIIRN